MKDLLYILFITLIFSSCSNKNSISGVDTNFGESIDVYQNLVLKFSKDFVQDSMIEKRDIR